jgi:hypothetical protein
MMRNVAIWQCESRTGMTAKDAVREFCADHWAWPRKHRKLLPNGMFEIVGGAGGRYQISLIRDGYKTLWMVCRLCGD